MRAHAWIDRRSLALHEAVAAKLEAQPQLVDVARANLRRWLGTNPAAALREWWYLLTRPPYQSCSRYCALLMTGASLPENLAAFCETLRRRHGFRTGPGELHDAARALDVVDLADQRAVRHALRPILGGTLDEVTAFDAAFTQFFFPGPGGLPQDQMASMRREPGTGADGRESDVHRARHAPLPGAEADEAFGLGDGPMTPLESTGDGLEEAAPGAMPRDRSFAVCTSACRAAGGRRARDDASIFGARCGPACRPAAKRCRRVGCAALGGRRDSCCWSTAAAR